MARPQEVNELFQDLRGRDANPDEQQQFKDVEYDTLRRSLEKPWAGQGKWLRNFFVEHMGREPSMADYKQYETANPGRVIEDVFNSETYINKQIEQDVKPLTKDDFFTTNRDEILTSLDEGKYNELFKEAEDEAREVSENTGKDYQTALDDSLRNKGYYEQDTQSNLDRLGTQEGYAQEDYDTSLQSQQEQNKISRRNFEGNLNRRKIYKGGIADTLRGESEKRLEAPISRMNKAFQRRTKGFQDQRQDIATGQERYNDQYGRRMEGLEEQKKRGEISRERALKKRRRQLTSSRDQESGSLLTERYGEQLSSKSFTQ